MTYLLSPRDASQLLQKLVQDGVIAAETADAPVISPVGFERVMRKHPDQAYSMAKDLLHASEYPSLNRLFACQYLQDPPVPVRGLGDPAAQTAAFIVELAMFAVDEEHAKALTPLFRHWMASFASNKKAMSLALCELVEQTGTPLEINKISCAALDALVACGADPFYAADLEIRTESFVDVPRTYECASVLARAAANYPSALGHLIPERLTSIPAVAFLRYEAAAQYYDRKSRGDTVDLITVILDCAAQKSDVNAPLDAVTRYAEIVKIVDTESADVRRSLGRAISRCMGSDIFANSQATRIECLRLAQFADFDPGEDIGAFRGINQKNLLHYACEMSYHLPDGEFDQIFNNLLLHSSAFNTCAVESTSTPLGGREFSPLSLAIKTKHIPVIVHLLKAGHCMSDHDSKASFELGKLDAGTRSDAVRAVVASHAAQTMLKSKQPAYGLESLSA